jgi:hypothetical protein
MAYQEYHWVNGEDVEVALRFLFVAIVVARIGAAPQGDIAPPET